MSLLLSLSRFGGKYYNKNYCCDKKILVCVYTDEIMSLIVQVDSQQDPVIQATAVMYIHVGVI